MIQHSTLKRKGAGIKIVSFLTLLFSLAALQSMGQETWEFSNAGATGRLGPNQAQVNSVYSGTNLASSVTIETQGIQEWTVPTSGPYLIEVQGAQGGNTNSQQGGKGAFLSGEFDLEAGDVLSIVVGQQGLGGSSGATGGGGGSYVTLGNDHQSSTALVIAGGGSGTGGNDTGNDALTTTLSGAGESCLAGVDNGQGGNHAGSCGGGAGGAGGFLTDGQSSSGWSVQRGYAFRNGAEGGTSSSGNSHGGFGGGAGTHSNNTGGGAGGGYSGGSAPFHGSTYEGGGGGSFNSGVEQIAQAGTGSGHGYVRVTLLYAVSATNIENATCPESADGTITAQVTGGEAPYTFEWSNEETYTTGEPIDDYSLLGHFEENSYYRSDNQIATAEAAQTEAEEHYGNLISITSAEENAWILANGIQAGDNLGASDATQEGTWLWASGESFAYSNWSAGEPNNGGGTGQNYIQIYADGTWDDVAWAHGPDARHVIETSPVSRIENLTPGDYTVTVTDANGLVTSATFIVGPDPLEVSFDMTQTSTCDETGDGAATANVTGGTAPYSYAWGSGESDQSISNKALGSYEVTVTDANNCNPAVESVEITANDLTPPVASVLDIDVYLDHTGSASISAYDIDGGSTDDCSISDYSIDVSEFSCDAVDAEPAFDGNTVLAFDGEDDYLEFDQVIPYSANHTFAFWIKTEPGSGGTAFTWGSPTVNNSTGLRIWSNRIRYSSVDGPGQTQTVNTSAFLGDNEWHHVVAVRNGTDVQIFVDGQLNVSGQITNQISNPTSTSLGGGLINGVYQSFMNGQLDEFAYWPQALSQQEAEGLMCAGIQGAEVFLDFESGAGTAAVSDASGNDNGATLNNMDASEDWVAFGDAIPLTSCPAGVKVRLSVTDAGGNQAHADAYVTVTDTISPVASARSHSLELNLNGEVTATAQDFDDGSTDNCGIEGFSLNRSEFNCEDLGVNDIVLTVTDIHGNTRSAGTQVTIVDNVSPIVEVQNIQIPLDGNGQASISVEDIEMGSADNCAIASKVLDIDQFSCEDYGSPVEVELTVTDNSGNETSATALVTILDQTAPVANPNDITVQLDENGSFVIDNQMVANEISNDQDDCSGVNPNSIVVSQMEFSCEDLGSNTVSYALSDQAGNIGGANFTVTVEDNTDPAILVTGNLIVELDENGFATVDPETAPLPAGDNCGIVSRSLSQTEFSCEDLGWNEITFSVVDASGNEAQMAIQAQVQDNVAPVIAESLDMNIYLDENGLANFDSDPLLAQATDNCELDMIAYRIESTYIDAEEFLSFDCASVGSLSEPVSVTDINGNGTEFLLNMTIIDTIKPSFNLNAIELQVDMDGTATLSEEMLTQYAADNCGVAEVAIQTEQFDCSQIGATQFTEIIVFDLHGNTKQQTLEVQLTDAIAPQVQVEDLTVELGEDGLMNLNVDLLEMMIIDNCEPTDFVFSKSEFSCADLGTTAQSITVTDASGNSGEAEFTLTVVDNASPEISGPQIIDVCQGVPISYDQIVATDDCSAELNVIDGPQAGDTPEAGEFMVEFEAVDPSGNTTSAMVMLAVSPIAEVELGEDMEVDEGTEITLIAGENNANEYLWNNGGTANIYQFFATEDETVSVEVTTPDGCSVTDEINITIGSFLSVDEDKNGNSVKFFPNPTKGQMTIALSLTEVATDARINVTDIHGKSVAQKIIPIAQDGDIISLDMSSFADGIYLVNIQSDSFTLTERVVKQ